MKLEIGNFHVKDVQFGTETSFHDGLLTIDKEAAIGPSSPASPATSAPPVRAGSTP